MTRMSDSPFAMPRLSPRHWALPALVLLLTLPLWRPWYEPGLFYALNQSLAVLPDLAWSLLSLLGTGWAVFAFTAPALWRRPRVLLVWLCAAPFAGIFTRAGKSFFYSPRPLEALGPEGIRVIGEPLFVAAMPSGHTITAFAAATAIYFSLNPDHRRRHLWLFALASGVALSRVAVGAHWPADVAVGAALGILSGLCGAWLCSRLPTSWLQPASWPTRAAAVLGIYCAYVLLSDEMGFAQNLPFQYLLAAYLGANLLLYARHCWRRQANLNPEET